jgi:hypothetical protein
MMDQEPERDYEEEDEADIPLGPQMPVGIVLARITTVSGMSFAAAFAIFFLVGGIWLLALAGLAGTIIFMALMFFIERGAESAAHTGYPGESPDTSL